jgi:hypothetical protein
MLQTMHACQSLQQSEYIMGMHAETKLPRVVYSNVEIAHRYLSLVCRLATCSQKVAPLLPTLFPSSIL